MSPLPTHWLMKSEPDAYSLADLQTERSTLWDGIRNYQARNFMRAMQVGDRAFFYHSNVSPPGIVGLMEVLETGLIDPSQFNPDSKYHDPRSTPQNPRWDCVRVGYLRTFPNLLSLDVLRDAFTEAELAVVRKGNRLSIVPVTQDCALRIYGLLGCAP